jgi:hypothetical protein
MRPAFAASASCLCLLVLAAQLATPQTPASPSAAPPSAMTPAAVQVANDAAARHARRTACLKEAKAKKLIGDDKTTFLKSCVDAPADAIAASRVQ